RDLAWTFLDAGRRAERALRTVDLLRQTLAQERPPVVDGQLTESVLRSCDSLITYRRRLAAGQGPASPVQAALDLLLLDPANPRSVRFQLDQLDIALRDIQDPDVTRRVSAARGVLAGIDLDTVCGSQRTGLQQVLQELHSLLTQLGAAIETTYFSRTSTQQAMRAEFAEPEGMRQSTGGTQHQTMGGAGGMTQIMSPMGES
ncbi:MAG: alpha-E domain-containing protein, partial [Allobranchiibius sp.]